MSNFSVSISRSASTDSLSWDSPYGSFVLGRGCSEGELSYDSRFEFLGTPTRNTAEIFDARGVPTEPRLHRFDPDPFDCYHTTYRFPMPRGPVLPSVPFTEAPPTETSPCAYVRRRPTRTIDPPTRPTDRPLRIVRVKGRRPTRTIDPPTRPTDRPLRIVRVKGPRPTPMIDPATRPTERPMRIVKIKVRGVPFKIDSRHSHPPLDFFDLPPRPSPPPISTAALPHQAGDCRGDEFWLCKPCRVAEVFRGWAYMDRRFAINYWKRVEEAQHQYSRFWLKNSTWKPPPPPPRLEPVTSFDCSPIPLLSLERDTLPPCSPTTLLRRLAKCLQLPPPADSSSYEADESSSLSSDNDDTFSLSPSDSESSSDFDPDEAFVDWSTMADPFILSDPADYSFVSSEATAYPDSTDTGLSSIIRQCPCPEPVTLATLPVTPVEVPAVGLLARCKLALSSSVAWFKSLFS